MWPLNRTEALQQLDDFIVEALPHFGDFQDALTHRAWRLFHSLLSFALNTKMLNPREVIGKAAEAHESGRVPLAAAEGRRWMLHRAGPMKSGPRSKVCRQLAWPRRREC